VEHPDLKIRLQQSTRTTIDRVPAVWLRQAKSGIALRLSRIETEILNAIHSNSVERAQKLAAKHGMLQRDAKGNLVPNRERSEFELKIHELGLILPWEL